MPKGVKRAPSELTPGATYYMERKNVPAGTCFAPHWHDYFEFELVLSGEGVHGCNRKSEPLSRGSAYLMAYYDFHELYAVTDLELLKIQCTEQALPQELRDHILLGNGRFCATLGEAQIEKITALFSLIEQERAQHAAFEKNMVQYAISAIFITLLRHCVKQAPQALPLPLVTALRAVQARFAEDLTLEALATAAFVTPNYLGALFKKWTGCTFPTYLNTVRLRHACDLLVTTKLSVKEIAFTVGYRSVEHFCYTFKRLLGCTPRTFRQGRSGTKLFVDDL